MNKHEVEIGGEFGVYKCVAEFKDMGMRFSTMFVWHFTIYEYCKILGIGFWSKEESHWGMNEFMNKQELELYCTTHITDKIIKPYQYKQSQLKILE
jgi:hypothetical protein